MNYQENKISSERSVKVYKKKLLLLFLIFILPAVAFSQNKFGQTSVNAGVSCSVWRGLHKIPFNDYETHFKFTTGKQAAIDRSLLRVFSIGIGYTYHKHILQIQDYEYTLNGETFTENPEYTVIASSFYIRGLVHYKDIFNDSHERIDLYGGLHQSYFLWTSTNTSNDPNFYDFHESKLEFPSLVGGIRLYPTKFIGIYVECSIPGSYTCAAGISVRIGGRDKFLK